MTAHDRVINLDPQAKFLLDLLAQAKRIPYSEITAGQARAQFLELCRRTRSPHSWDVAAADLAIPGPAGPLPARAYRPRQAAVSVLPALVFFHGGGWCIGDLETHDAACRQIAAAADCAVIAIDYRLAPEHRFPGAVEDCFAALRFVAREASSLGVDAARIAVGGDSAGGNLAAVIALMARDAGLSLRSQILFYPAVDLVAGHPSHEEFAEGFLLTKEAITWFLGNYIDPAQRADWRASPLRARDLSGLPPALLLIGECDPLRDEGQEYAARLAAAGNQATCRLYPGMIHGFLTMGGVMNIADTAINEAAAALRAAFSLSA